MHPMTPVLKDFERFCAWHREAHDRLLEGLDLPEAAMPYRPPAHCQHFEGGTEDCPFVCLFVFGERFLIVERS